MLSRSSARLAAQQVDADEAEVARESERPEIIPRTGSPACQ